MKRLMAHDQFRTFGGKEWALISNLWFIKVEDIFTLLIKPGYQQFINSLSCESFVEMNTKNIFVYITVYLNFIDLKWLNIDRSIIVNCDLANYHQLFLLQWLGE